MLLKQNTIIYWLKKIKTINYLLNHQRNMIDSVNFNNHKIKKIKF